MSKILSYNNKTTGEGWITLNGQYGPDEINEINDPNGGLSLQPRTAIPSPFAQMDLVKNAFRRLAMSPNLEGELMDERLVANALDIAQLFLNYPELQSQLHIIVWDKDAELRKLEAEPSHKLLADTLRMFIAQDKEAFNFDRMDRLYFLQAGSEVIGSTSPVTLFMATPNARPGMSDITVEQNVKLFQANRPLHQREPRFVACLYALFTAYPALKSLCGEVNAYLITNFPLLPQSLQDTILNDIGNPSAMDTESSDRALRFLQSRFEVNAEQVQVLGVPFYTLRQTDIVAAIEKSDFRIKPSLTPDGERLPLILCNHPRLATTGQLRYITGPWDDNITITPDDYAMAPDKRILPATSHQYPWLTANDFFEPTLIKLDYTSDHDAFFNGHLAKGSREADDNDFLLPLSETFFKYFTVRDLMGTIGGKPRFEIIHTGIRDNEEVNVVLRIPVQKEGQYITLKRTYLAANGTTLHYDRQNDRGYFITLPFAISIFPFTRNSSLRQYQVQLVDRALGQLEHCNIRLKFHCEHADGQSPLTVQRRSRSLKSEKRVGSDYYRVADSFDRLTVSLSDDRGTTLAEGLLCPKWPEPIEGHDGFTFAVDFGTTNTHVECMRQGQSPEPLKVSAAARQRLVATLYNGDHILYDVILKQEFLPKAIGEAYGFPQRTVLSESERLDVETIDEMIPLGDSNIPFIYEKESVGYGNRIVPNLKWSTELSTAKRAKAFLTELAQLMRAKVLLENGDLTKTRLVWFYPLSMKTGNVRKMGDLWARTFHDIFGTTADQHNLIPMPESVAPYYFYRVSNHFKGAASTVVSIDIGGGTSDVVVFDGNKQQPDVLTSFRFAANTLFGDGFSEMPQGDTNPMVTKYTAYFRKLFNADDDKYGELNGILDDITAKKKSEEINTFLFSIADNKVTGGNDVFSYNLRLNEDGRLKIVFLYFYSALIYYVARMMQHRSLDMPHNVMFSGTGSKVLDIVGGQRELDQLTQAIFERVYGKAYDSNGFSVVMERKAPKQITCKGGLLQVRDDKGCACVEELNRMMDSFDSHLVIHYTAISKETLTYADMDADDVRKEIVEAVMNFNRFFCQLCDDIHVVDRFLVDNQAYHRFKDLMDKDLEHHLIMGWNFVNKNQADHNATDEVEDTVFFYPIIGSIRENLIEHL